MKTSTSVRAICPRCGHTFALAEAIVGELSERVRSEVMEEALEREQALENQISELTHREEELRARCLELDAEAQHQVQSNQARFEARMRKEMEATIVSQREELEFKLNEKTIALKKAHEQELLLRREQRRLQEDRGELELEMERKLDAERANMQEKLAEEIEGKARLKLAEREKIIDDLRRELDILQRKATQGSQQIQGEVLEMDLAANLTSSFPADDVTSVSNGVRGADIAQTVYTSNGRRCGVILYESKRTKAWSNAWLPKLRDDMRNANAEIGVIVTETMPDGIRHFGLIEGVWVTDAKTALPLAASLRFTLQQLMLLKRSQEGAQDKGSVLYAYLTGIEFRQRVEGVLEAFSAMKSDLESEKRAITKHWARREKQIGRGVESMASMFGGIQGLAGSSVPDSKELSFLC